MDSRAAHARYTCRQAVRWQLQTTASAEHSFASDGQAEYLSRQWRQIGKEDADWLMTGVSQELSSALVAGRQARQAGTYICSAKQAGSLHKVHQVCSDG